MYTYIAKSLSLSLSLSIYIYIYIYVCACVSVCVCVFVCVCVKVVFVNYMDIVYYWICVAPPPCAVFASILHEPTRPTKLPHFQKGGDLRSNMKFKIGFELNRNLKRMQTGISRTKPPANDTR